MFKSLSYKRLYIRKGVWPKILVELRVKIEKNPIQACRASLLVYFSKFEPGKGDVLFAVEGKRNSVEEERERERERLLK